MSATDPLISVILACYNQERFVADAVNGVLGQTYEPLEIIIFDDHSTDRTPEIIHETIAAHPKQRAVTLIRNEKNISGYEVTAKGLAMVTGRFIVISHGDDIMMPEMIAEMARVWQAGAVSLVTANSVFIDGDSHLLGRTYRDPDVPGDDSFETLARDGGNACCQGAALGFDREIYDRFGWIPPHLTAYDIMYPFFAYLLNGARFLQRPLLKYRVHGQNSSLSLTAERESEIAQKEILEKIHLGHLDHAILMQDHLLEATRVDPRRYNPIAAKITPLLEIQTIERARKLVRTRVELHRLRGERPRAMQATV